MGNNPADALAFTSIAAVVLRRDLTCLRAEFFMKLLLELKTSKELGPVNLLPLCRLRQALQGATAPARRFERILKRAGLRVNEFSKEKSAGQQAFPIWSVQGGRCDYVGKGAS